MVLIVEAFVHDSVGRAEAVEVLPVKKRRGGRSRRVVTGFVVGMIILDGNGRLCRIVAIDEKGWPWCLPVQP